jgi:hypothetical protein
LHIAVAIPFFLLLTTIIHRGIEILTPNTYDMLLQRWDFGVAAAVRSWALGDSWRWYPIAWCYEGLPAAVLLVLVSTTGISYRRLLWSLALAGALAIPCYLLFPAVGPIHVGNPYAPRNCMPSLHLTWALLLLVNPNKWIRLAVIVYSLLMALATLATGEHYTLDLLIALPFSWGVIVLARWFTNRNLESNIPAE